MMDRLAKGTKWGRQHRVFRLDPSNQDTNEQRPPQPQEMEELERQTMEEFTRMASQMLECLNFTWDCPGLNIKKKMPLLDTQVRVGLSNEEWGVPVAILDGNTTLPKSSECRLILYEFYRKTKANQRPMHHRTAAPEKTKVQTATNEFIRRFKNCSRELPVKVIDGTVQRYAEELMKGGFSQNWVKNALGAAATGYARMAKSEIEGKVPVNRPEKSGRKTRLVKKLVGKSTWFKSKNNPDQEQEVPTEAPAMHSRVKNSYAKAKKEATNPETVMFIPHTPDSGLKKALQGIDDLVNNGSKFGHVKMVETQGVKLNQGLSNTAPWSSKHCGRQDCEPCKEKEGSCMQRNITYKVICQECGMLYWGETHRTWWDRAVEHRIALRTNDTSNALAKHQAIHHPGEVANFKFKVDKGHKISLNRLIREAIMISQENPSMLMNSKAEWGMSNTIPRVRVVESEDSAVQDKQTGRQGQVLQEDQQGNLHQGTPRKIRKEGQTQVEALTSRGVKEYFTRSQNTGVSVAESSSRNDQSVINQLIGETQPKTRVHRREPQRNKRERAE